MRCFNSTVKGYICFGDLLHSRESGNQFFDKTLVATSYYLFSNFEENI